MAQNFLSDIKLVDDVKAQFGDGGDLKIWHDSGTATSYISDQGSGDLYIQADSMIRLESYTGTEKMATFHYNGAVKLYYDNSLKFETTSAGATVTGDVTLGTSGKKIIADFSSGGTTRKTELELYNSSDGGFTLNNEHSSTGGIKFQIDGGDALSIAKSGKHATFAGNIELGSSKRIRWGAGDAQIEEGVTANYSLDFSTYDGSSMTTALTLLSNNDATFTGNISTAADKRISIGTWDNSAFTGGAAHGYYVSAGTPLLILEESDQSKTGYVGVSGGNMYVGGVIDNFYIQTADGSNRLTINSGAATFNSIPIRTTEDIGRDAHNRIMFSTDDSIIYRVADTHRFRMDSDNFSPYADSSYDLGTSSLYFRAAYIDAITTTGNVTVGGDLTVNGTTTTVNQTNLDVSDNIIGLNRGAGSNANDSGIIIERGSTGDNAAFLWDESIGYFSFGTTQETASSTGAIANESDWTWKPIKASGAVYTGGIYIGGTTEMTGYAYIAERIVHTGDTDTYLRFVDNNPHFFAGGVNVLDLQASETQFTGDLFTFTSANSTDPLVNIKNTTNDANGARLRFTKDKGAAGADDDVVGQIEFVGDNAAQELTEFAKIQGSIETAADGTEGGRLRLGVASHDGEMRYGLVLHDGDAEDEIDVSIGGGAASVTTVAGDLSIYNKLTFRYNDNHYIQSGTNNWAFKANSGSVALSLTTGGAAEFAGNVSVNGAGQKAVLHVKNDANSWEDGVLLEHHTGNTGWNIHPEDNSDNALWFGYNSDTSVALTSQAATAVLKLNSDKSAVFEGGASIATHSSIGSTSLTASNAYVLDVKKAYSSGNGHVAYFGAGADTAAKLNYDTVVIAQDDVTCLAIIEGNDPNTHSTEQALRLAVGDNSAVISSTSTASNGMYFYTNRDTDTYGYQINAGTRALHLANTGNATFGYDVDFDGHITLTGSSKNIVLNYNNEIRTKDSGGTERTVLRAASDKLQYGWSFNGAVEFMGGGSYTPRITINTDGSTTFASSVHLDNDSAQLQLGDDNDMQVYHNGANGYVKTGTGDLILQSNGDDVKILAEDDVVIRDNDDSTEMAKFINGGAVELYHNGSKKFETTSAGATFSGAVTVGVDDTGYDVKFFGATAGKYMLWDESADRLEIVGEISISGDGSNDVVISESGSGHLTIDAPGNINLDADGGDINLKDGTTFWGQLTQDSSHFIMEAKIADKDIILRGTDNTTQIDALRLDMSEGGDATFASHIALADEKQIQLGNLSGGDIKLYHVPGVASYFLNKTDDLRIINQADDKDIIFETDNGSGSTTAYITLDGSAVLTQFDKNTKHVDNIRADFGNSSDLQLYHDGSHSYIQNWTGSWNFRNYVADGNTVFAADDGQGGGNIADYFSLDGGSATHDGSATTALYTKWPDKSRIALGTGKDLQLYHDGSNSYIRDTGTGSLFVQGDNIYFRKDDFVDYMASFVADGAVSLYYDNSKKFETTSTGIEVTGHVDMDTGNSSGKFAVMSSAVHASYDFYNNGTSYFNGAVTVDDALTMSGTNAQINLPSLKGVRLHDNTTQVAFELPYFTNATADLAADIILGNHSIYGILELTLTAGYSHQNAVGEYKFKWILGVNANNSIWYTPQLIERRVTHHGPSQIYVADPAWDSTNSRYYIRVYHKASSGNNWEGHLKYTSLNSTASDFISNLSISGLLTSTSTANSHPVGHFLSDQTGDMNLILQSKASGDPTLTFNSEATNRSGIINFEDQGTITGAIQYRHNGDIMKFITGGTGSGHEELTLNESAGAVFRTNAKANAFLVNNTSAVGIGSSMGDANAAELGPGYLNLSRDDTASAKQIVFEKNDAEHTAITTDDTNFTIDTAKDVVVTSEHLVHKSSSPEFYFHTTGNHCNWLIAAQEASNATLEFSAIAASTSLDTDASNYTPILKLGQGGGSIFAGQVTIEHNDGLRIKSHTGTYHKIYHNTSTNDLAFSNAAGGDFDFENWVRVRNGAAGSILFEVDSTSGHTGIGGQRDTSYELYVHGATYLSGSLAVNGDANITGHVTGRSLTSHNNRGSGHGGGQDQEFPIGHWNEGEEVFSIDPTWTNDQLQNYFGSSNVEWLEDSTAPAGWAIKITNGVNVGGAYDSGFPYIAIDEDAIYYMECHIRGLDSDTSVNHYMGSIDYKEDFNCPSSGCGNPGSYGYWVMSNANTSGQTWTKATGIIRGFHNTTTGMFETGAKYWTPQALFNYSHGAGTRACVISGWKVVKISKQRMLADGAQATPSLTFAEDTNTGLYRPGTDQMTFATGGSDAILIDSSQNVTVKGDLTAAGGSIFINDANTELKEGGGNAVRIDTNSGYLDIGPMNTSYCHMQTDRARFYMNTQLVVDTGIIGSYNEDVILRRADDSTYQMTLSTTAATFTHDVVAFSDKKLKKNIKTLDGSKVYDMRGVSFTRKDNGEDGSGVIAQEMQEIAPELVNETDGTLGVSYGNITGYLIEAIKDLKAEIEELKKCNKCNDCNCK